MVISTVTSSTVFSTAVAVVDVAAMHAQDVLQRHGIDRADIGLNLDFAEAIKGAFLDREGDDEALDRGIVFAGRRDHLHVGIAVSQVETPDQVAVGLDAVGVVDVGGLQKAQEIRVEVLITSLSR